MECKKKFKLFIFLTIFITIFIIKSSFNFFKIKQYNNFPLYPKRYPKFLNKNQIKLILNQCKLFQKSTTFNSKGKLEINNFRTSETCFLDNELSINKMLKKKIKKIFNLDNEIEKLQVTHYNTNQYYYPHYDYFTDNKLIERPQRIKTIFVYLKCPEEGGETNFPRLNIKFKPVLGDAVAWTNCKRNNNAYEYYKWSLHEGSIVKKGEKIGLNIWILDK